MLKATLRKSGTSLVITIPPAIIDIINAKEGSEFEVKISTGYNGLILNKVN